MIWSFKRLNLIFVAAFFLGLFTRLFFPHYFPLNFDELIQYDVLTIVDGKGVFNYLKNHERQGPLTYFLYLPVVKLFPQNIFAIRGLSVLIGISTLILFTKLAKQVFPPKEGTQQMAWLFSCALFAISYFPLAFSFSMRPYGVLTLFTVVTLIFFIKLLREGEEHLLKNGVSFFLGLLFLSLSHPFGLLQSGILGFLVLFKGIQVFDLKERAPFTYFTIKGLLVLISLLTVAYFIEKNPFGFHPSHWPPYPEKIAAAFVWSAGSHLNFLVLILLIIYFHIYKKHLFKMKELSVGILLYFFPVILAYFISRFFYPVFELRYFGHLSVIYCLLVSFYLFHGLGVHQKLGRTISFIVLTSTFIFTFHQREILGDKEALNFNKLKEVLPALNEVVVLNCGNCPSFYFAEDKIQCLQGWNFTRPTYKNPDKEPGAFILFKRNDFFCRKHVPKDWKSYPFSDLEVFLKP